MRKLFKPNHLQKFIQIMQSIRNRNERSMTVNRFVLDLIMLQYESDI